jgi:tetratricopeptide (TPR) repeat protein
MVECERLLRKTLTDTNDSYGVAFSRLSEVYQARGQFDEAERALKRALELEPQDTQMMVALATLWVRTKRQSLPEVERVLSEALKLADTAALRFKHGFVLQQLKRFDEAEADYRVGLEKEAQTPASVASSSSSDPTRDSALRIGALGEDNWIPSSTLRSNASLKVKALFNMANLRKQQDRPNEAEKLYLEAIACDPTCYKIHFNLGNLYRNQNRLHDAEQCYRRTLECSSENLHAHLYLASLLRETCRLDEALVHYRRAHNIDPSSKSIASRLVQALISKNTVFSLREALAVAQKLAVTTPGHHHSQSLMFRVTNMLESAESNHQEGMEIMMQ